MLQQIVRGLFGAEAEQGDYQCQNCGALYGQRRQVCPDCDGFRIERREW